MPRLYRLMVDLLADGEGRGLPPFPLCAWCSNSLTSSPRASAWAMVASGAVLSGGGSSLQVNCSSIV